MARFQLKGVVDAALERSPLLRPLRSPLHANALFLVLSTGTTGLLGLAFWVTAARLSNPAGLGLVAALVSVSNQLGQLSGLGLDLGLIRFLPERRQQAQKLINAVLTLGGLVGMVAGAIFLAGVTVWSPALRTVHDRPGYIPAFLGLVAGIVLVGMVNASFMGFRRASYVLATNVLAGGLRLLLLLGLAAALGTFGILVAWSLSLWAAVLVALVVLLPRLHPGYRPWPRLAASSVRPLALYSGMNYLALLFFHAQLHLVPLMVLNRIGAEANAYYFSAMALASPSWVIPLAVSLVVVVEGAHDSEQLASILRKGLTLAAALQAPVLAFLWFGGGFLLLAFGQRYSQEGLQALRLLALAGIPVVLIDFYVAVGRVQKQMAGPVALLAMVSLGTLCGAYFLTSPMGILGAATALLVANGAGGLWALWRLAVRLRASPRAPTGHSLLPALRGPSLH